MSCVDEQRHYRTLSSGKGLYLLLVKELKNWTFLDQYFKTANPQGELGLKLGVDPFSGLGNEEGDEGIDDELDDREGEE